MTPESIRGNPLLEGNRLKALVNLRATLQSPEESILRAHQISVIDAVVEFLQAGETAGYLSEPTGVGKSAVMIILAQAMGFDKTLILSPTQQILEQTFREARRFAPDLSITNYYSRSKNLEGGVVNTTYHSGLDLVKKKSDGPSRSLFVPDEVGLVLCDEAHLALGDVRHTIYREFPNAILIGLTATPAFDPIEVYKDQGLIEGNERWVGLFEKKIHEMKLEEAMERGILSHAHIHLLRTNTRVGKISLQADGEYSPIQLERHLAIEARNALVIGMLAGVDRIPSGIRLPPGQIDELDKLHELIRGQPTAVFGLSVQHIEGLVKILQERGLSAAAVSHKTDPSQREKIFSKHKAGDIQVVLGVGILGIGWDSPPTTVGIFMRPTQSGTTLVQEFGRILRLSPETGKDTAIAIQLVDQFARAGQTPVLLPQIFDADFVVRGMQKSALGRKDFGTQAVAPSERPLLSIYGMDLQFVLEQAETRQIFRERFQNKSVPEMHSLLEKAILQIREKDPTISLYALCRTLADALPGQMPKTLQQTVVKESMTSSDPLVREQARRLILLFNLKTILSVVEPYFVEHMRDEQRDEIISEAVVYLMEKYDEIATSAASMVSNNIHRIAKTGVVAHLAKKQEMPASWVRNAALYMTFISSVRDMVDRHDRRLTHGEIDEIASVLAESTRFPKEDLVEYIDYRNAVNVADSNEPLEKPDDISEELPDDRERAVKEAIDNMQNKRERRVIELRFGFVDGASHTLEEVAGEFGVTRERIRQIETKALRKLRHPLQSRRLRGYVDS